MLIISLAQAPSCRAVLLPIQGVNGELSWDFGRFQSIGAVGEAIRHHCVMAAGMPGMGSSDGMELAGKREPGRS